MKDTKILDLLKYALHLRMNGENAPGGNEIWKEFDTKCEEYLREVTKTDDISDGYHTFGELYDHRRALTAALMSSWNDISWRSKEHHPDDNPMFEGGYFIVGISLPNGQISYHYKLNHWDDFSAVQELSHAPKWDGHTPELTISRLLEWAK